MRAERQWNIGKGFQLYYRGRANSNEHSSLRHKRRRRGYRVVRASDTLRDHSFIYFYKGTFTTLDAPGTSFDQARAINNRGEVAVTADGHPYIYNNGIFTTIEVPGIIPGIPSGMSINNRGEVVGTYFDGTTVSYHGYLYNKGAITTLDAPGANGF